MIVPDDTAIESHPSGWKFASLIGTMGTFLVAAATHLQINLNNYTKCMKTYSLLQFAEAEYSGVMRGRNTLALSTP